MIVRYINLFLSLTRLWQNLQHLKLLDLSKKWTLFSQSVHNCSFFFANYSHQLNVPLVYSSVIRRIFYKMSYFVTIETSILEMDDWHNIGTD